MNASRIRVSKLLSLVLRHDPARIGIVLDDAGWTSIAALLERLEATGTSVTREELDAIVRTSDKRRFAVSDDGLRIRASQGHSVDVDLGYAPAAPPEVLFHGTVAKFLSSIRAQGLIRGERHHVHLSAAEDTARQVGGRRGRPVILQIRADVMARDGHAFLLSANGVWLTEHVPASYIVFPDILAT